MKFEWDPAKEASNYSNHAVTFRYATRIFLDPYRIEQEDTREDYGEVRIQTIGMVGDHLLVVVYTDREEAIRIISARKAERYERRRYHELRAGP